MSANFVRCPVRFDLSVDASGVRQGCAEAVANLKKAAAEAGRVSSAVDATGVSFRRAADEAGYFYDHLGRLHAANGRYASSAEKAAIQTRAVGSSSEISGKKSKGMNTETSTASAAFNKTAAESKALGQRLESLAKTVLATYSAYKLMSGAVAATNGGFRPTPLGSPKSWSLRLSYLPRTNLPTRRAGCLKAQKSSRPPRK